MINPKKDKSYDIIYGKPKADKIREKISKTMKGITLEKRFGKPKANKIKLKMSNVHKGNLEKRFGKSKANRIKLKQSEAKKDKNKVWTKDKIINNLIEIIKKTGSVTRSSLKHLCHYYDICGEDTIRRNFGSFDNLALEGNIEFKVRRGKVGTNEKQILDNIELEKGITLLRQYSVAGKYIDGYDKINNIAYEVDELHHKYQKIEDLIREDKIKAVLDCEFIRIKK